MTRRARGSTVEASEMGVADRQFTAYLVGEAGPPIIAASTERSWMGEMGRGPYRCLPLVIANSAGWFVLNEAAFAAVWDGGPGVGATRIVFDEQVSDRRYHAASIFGNGILTFHIPYVIRTAPGYNLLVRGPANLPKDAISALEGIVETDWSVATFTMNWKITRPGVRVAFDVNEPICMLVPQRRRELASFSPRVESVAANPPLDVAHAEWQRSRADFRRRLNRSRLEPTESIERWQKHYFRGITPSGQTSPDHETRLHLKSFEGRSRAGGPKACS